MGDIVDIESRRRELGPDDDEERELLALIEENRRLAAQLDAMADDMERTYRELRNTLAWLALIALIVILVSC